MILYSNVQLQDKSKFVGKLHITAKFIDDFSCKETIAHYYYSLKAKRVYTCDHQLTNICYYNNEEVEQEERYNIALFKLESDIIKEALELHAKQQKAS